MAALIETVIAVALQQRSSTPSTVDSTASVKLVPEGNLFPGSSTGFGKRTAVEGAQTREIIGGIHKLQNTSVRYEYNIGQGQVSAYRDGDNLMPMEALCRVQTSRVVNRLFTLGEPQYLTDRLTLRRELALCGSQQNNQLPFPRVKPEISRIAVVGVDSNNVWGYHRLISSETTTISSGNVLNLI
ncbi:hypothetical protein J6590_007250 [Homalodisca vitripennis]|nr:hypothetical protein J6590_007250 [Homalodisca vitripennis]